MTRTSDVYEPGVMCLARLNDIEREFTKLDEHIASANVNFRDRYTLVNTNVTLRAEAYSEFRSRTYNTRSFIYNRNPEGCTLPANFQYLDIANELLTDANYGADKLYMLENVRWTNNYRGRNMLAAGYVSANVAWHALNVYAGAGAAYMPQAGSKLIGAASFSDALLNGVTPVNYVGAFAAGDTWMDGWTNFDPNNTDY